MPTDTPTHTVWALCDLCGDKFPTRRLTAQCCLPCRIAGASDCPNGGGGE